MPYSLPIYYSSIPFPVLHTSCSYLSPISLQLVPILYPRLIQLYPLPPATSPPSSHLLRPAPSPYSYLLPGYRKLQTLTILAIQHASVEQTSEKTALIRLPSPLKQALQRSRAIPSCHHHTTHTLFAFRPSTSPNRPLVAPCTTSLNFPPLLASLPSDPCA